MSRFLPEERAQILESADRLARERLAPLAPRMDAGGVAREAWPMSVRRGIGASREASARRCRVRGYRCTVAGRPSS
jgi:hypothetical protein